MKGIRNIMKYNCVIKEVGDEYYDGILIQIENVELFVFPITYSEIPNEIATVELDFFDDVEILEAKQEVKKIIRIGDSYSYDIYGILDIDAALIKSEIELYIDPEYLYDYGYLHDKYVVLKVSRIDAIFN